MAYPVEELKAGNNGDVNSGFSAKVNEVEKFLVVEEHLGNNVISPSVNLLLQKGDVRL